MRGTLTCNLLFIPLSARALRRDLGELEEATVLTGQKKKVEGVDFLEVDNKSGNEHPLCYRSDFRPKLKSPFLDFKNLAPYHFISALPFVREDYCDSSSNSKCAVAERLRVSCYNSRYEFKP